MDLKLGDVICSDCNGEGLIPSYFQIKNSNNSSFYYLDYTCDKCEGAGKLGWIENITGIKKSTTFFSYDDDLDVPF